MLKVWDNGTDFWVAESAAAALADCKREYRLTDDEEALGEDGEWHEYPADKPLSIFDWNDDGTTKTQTAAEWVAEVGKTGFLASREF